MPKKENICAECKKKLGFFGKHKVADENNNNVLLCDACYNKVEMLEGVPEKIIKYIAGGIVLLVIAGFVISNVIGFGWGLVVGTLVAIILVITPYEMYYSKVQKKKNKTKIETIIGSQLTRILVYLISIVVIRGFSAVF